MAMARTTLRCYLATCRLLGKDRKTPAMRQGMAKAAIDPQEVLHFRK